MSIPVAAQVTAQGIQCGDWALALPSGWAQRVVDEFDLTPVPRAPGWLSGVANVQGVLVPVVDLGFYLSPQDALESQQARLLLGSCELDGGDESLALLFSGLPRQLRYQREQVIDAASLPVRLRNLCTGIARDGDGRPFHELDAQRLVSNLLDELQ